MRFDETGSLSKPIKTNFFMNFKMNNQSTSVQKLTNINLLQRAVENMFFCE